jgi:hypothetical protein
MSSVSPALSAFPSIHASVMSDSPWFSYPTAEVGVDAGERGGGDEGAATARREVSMGAFRTAPSCAAEDEPLSAAYCGTIGGMKHLLIVLLAFAIAPALLAVECKATLTNNSQQTLTLTKITADPNSGWTVPGGWETGRQFKPGDVFTGSYSKGSSGVCSASMTFSTSGGGTLSASFKNPAFKASSWSCSGTNVQCTAKGNKHGQPLKMTFTITDPSPAGPPK